MHVVKQLEFPIYEGQHEAIISEEDWNLAQAKRHLNGYRRERIRTIRQEQLTGENISRLLLAFEQLYNTYSEAEQRELMRAIIDRIDLYSEKPNDGCWIRKIIFIFPIPINGEEVQEFPLENQTMLETVVQLSKGNISSQNVKVEFSFEDMDMSRFQQVAAYEHIRE